MSEPWLSGTLGELHPVTRAVVHALEHARLDVLTWTADLTDAEAWNVPHGLAPAAFQMGHIAGSLDRLLTYAEGADLSAGQVAELRCEMTPGAPVAELRTRVIGRLLESETRVRSVDPARLGEPRVVGRRQLPTTLAGLLIHTAEHTQRHVGQLIVTVRVLRALRLVSEKGL